MRSRFALLIDQMLRFRRGIVIVLQLPLMALSNWLAFVLRFDGQPPQWAIETFWQALPWVISIRALAFIPFRLYEGLWKYTSLFDLKALLAGITVSSALFFTWTETSLGPPSYPRSVFFIDAILLLLMLGGLRLTRRIYGELSRPGGFKRVLIIGAGDAGELIVRDMKGDPERVYEPIGFIDDDRTKVGRRIHGVPVLGTRADIEKVIKKHAPDEILIAFPAAEPSATRAIVRSLQPYKLPLKTLPNLRDIIDGRVEVTQIRNVSVEDLLARAPVGLTPAPVERFIRGKRVLVTGAGGSIGSELCRQIAERNPASLVMLDRYENSLYGTIMELVDGGCASSLYAVVGDVTDSVRNDEILATYQPQIVFHAAAHKHVPLMEGSPCEAIKNNVRGTRLLAEAAERHGVDRFIMISTDKAVNPTSVMGASKRVAELLIQQQQKESGTSFATVRFGNVLGSNGSVVPRFVEQIRKGGPVTVTHPEMRRFFMLIPEAVQLVLHAAAQAEGGAIYVLEMGEQVKMVDMARDLIRLSGFVPDEDIQIQFVGLRPGEKLHEELVGAYEALGPSSVEKVFQVTSTVTPDADWRARVLELEQAAMRGEEAKTAALLQHAVTDYAPMIDEGVEAPRDWKWAGASPSRDNHEECPSCHHRTLLRSRARSMQQRVHRSLTEKRLCRCDHCGWRGWLVPVDRFTPAMTPAQAPVDLSGLDAELPSAPAPKPSCSPRDLQ